MNADNSDGTDIFAGQSRLDATVNKILHTVATSWGESIYQYAMKNKTVYDQPIVMTTYPHEYVIHVSWTPTTYVGLVLSLMISICAWALAYRWTRAIVRSGTHESWDLLRPLDLMAYSMSAHTDPECRELVHDLSTTDRRRKAMRGKTDTVLRVRPMLEGNSEDDTRSFGSATITESLTTPMHGKAFRVADPLAHATSTAS